MISPLSILLREGTKDSHRLAETTPFIRQFFAGQLTPEAYRLFLVQLHHVYSALEQTHQRHSGHPVYGQVYFPALFRVDALQADLEHYFADEDWRAIEPSQATKAYVQRIAALADEWADGLVAHHYTRYLGDLSGGQALKRIVAKTFGLTSSVGVSFYEFPLVEDHKQFKDDYRARLDALNLDADSCQRIVDEANHAFALNRDVFDAMLVTA